VKHFWQHSAGWQGAFLLLLIFLPSQGFAAVTVKTELERTTIMAGESTGLQISVEGGTLEATESFPQMKGVSVQYRGPQTSITIINGVRSAKQALLYTVTGSEPGEYMLPSIKIGVSGGSYATQPVKLTVTKSDIPQNRYAFLKLNVPKQEIYVGEVIPIEVQLYVTSAENVQSPQLKSDGFIVNKQVDAPRSQSQIGNIIYNVLSFKMGISAAKAGQLTLGPAESTLVLILRAQPDPSDFFGFGRIQKRQVTVSSSTTPMKVLPLPSTNVPPEFSGAIGSFNWTVAASPNTVNAGDPITLKVVVSGRGNLDNLKLPEVNWPDFKVYQPNSSIASDDPLGVEGTKTFEQVVVPQSASLHEIPAMSLAYFDPQKKSYVKLTQPAMPIKVNAAAAVQAQPTVLAPKGSEQEQPQERTDIVHIKSNPGPMIAMAPPLIEQPWFLMLQILPLAGFVGVSLWRKRQDTLANNPKLRRRIEVQKVVASGLAELKQLASAKQGEPFYALMFRLLQEQIGERLAQPASGITEAVLEERLPKRGASAEMVQRLRELFLICNQARYAPIRSDQELLKIAAKLEGALEELRRLPN
jgi:hypothetical protein